MRRVFLLFQENVFVRNSAILFSGTMAVNILNYVFHLMLGRSVDASVYGAAESIISLFAIVSVPAAALTMVATRYAAGMKERQGKNGIRKLFRYLNRRIFLYGMPVFVGMFLLTPVVKGFLRIEDSLPIMLLWIAMFLAFLSAVSVGLLTGWQKFGAVNATNILFTMLKFFGTFLFVKLGYGVNGMVGSFVLAGFLAYWLSRFFVGKMTTVTESEDQGNDEEIAASLATIKRYVFPALYGALSMAILGNADMVFAKHHLDPALSGEYGALFVASKTIFFVTSVLTTVMFAMSSADAERPENARQTFRMAALLTFLTATGSVLFFFFFPEFVMGIFFGDRYLAVSPLLGWFAVAAGLYSFGNLFLQYLLSLQRTRSAAYFLALSAFEIPLLFFFGEGLYVIIGITIAFQALIAFLGMFFILKQRYV